MEDVNSEQDENNVTMATDNASDVIFLAPLFYSSRSSTLQQQQQRRCELVMSFTINSLGAGFICLLGFIGNALSFAILSRDKSTSPVAAFLLKSLSFADNLFLSVWFVHSSLNDAFVYFGLDRSFHVSYYYLRIYSYPLVFIGQTATIWLTVLIAASRYIAVCLPYKASVYCNLSITRRGVMAVLAFSVLYNVPRFFETELATVTRKNVTRQQLQRSAMGQNGVYVFVYFDILYYIFSFVLPLLLLFLFNTRLTIAYRAVRKKRSKMRLSSCSAGRKDSHEQSITLVMIIVILVFMVCNAPARIVQIVLQYNRQECRTVSSFVTRLSTLLEVFSSSANFLVYVAFRKQFREALCVHLSTTCCSRRRRRLRDIADKGQTADDSLTRERGKETLEPIRQTVV